MSVNAQKYNFINYSVEHGLVQSQALNFHQDNYNRLWIGTIGGISIFDGIEFEQYNKSNGLPNNIINSIVKDKIGNIWIGTQGGLSKFDGVDFETYYPRGKEAEVNNIQSLFIDLDNELWIFTGDHKLIKKENETFKEYLENDTISCITIDNSGKIWVAIFNKGIYVLENGNFKKEIDVMEYNHLWIFDMSFGHHTGSLYCITSKNILIESRGKLIEPSFMELFPSQNFASSIMEDSKGNIWIALSNGGVWQINKQGWNKFNYANGLTDDNVTSFYEDNEKNIWIATNGSGVFRYSGSSFTFFDRESGLTSPSIISIGQTTKNKKYFVSSTGNMYENSKSGFTKVNLPKQVNRINSIVGDNSGNLWMGSLTGVWKFDGDKTSWIVGWSNFNLISTTHLTFQHQRLWISSTLGLFSYEQNKITKENVSIPIYTAHVLNDDSLILGTPKGAFIYLIKNKIFIEQPLLDNTYVLSIASDNSNIYFGTDDKGLVVWDRKKLAFNVFNTSSGLSCNYVYSLLSDRDKNIWIGTGCGIDKVSFNDGKPKIKNYGKSDGLLGVETNSNAVFEDYEGNVWFGTTKGLFKYKPDLEERKPTAPFVVLSEVQLFSRKIKKGNYTDSIIPFYRIPYDPVFHHTENHLSFSFKAICMANAERVRYRYQLIGIDNQYNETSQNTVIYPNLPSGKYIFKVWTSDPEGNWYDNAVAYQFTINAPYYTSIYFRIGIALLIAGFVLGLVYIRNRQKELRRRWKEKLREEEQARVRQSTAEDFHDEVGNKLTRISLLANIAEAKLQTGNLELKNILQQIQKNTLLLYNGAKDIIWSLQPESNHLQEIIFRIRQNAEEMLEDSDIKFHFTQSQELSNEIKDKKLPIDYSRNLILIFKEAINNSVKHSEANNIYFNVTMCKNNLITLSMKDDGKGYSVTNPTTGNGLQNIKNRSNRIGAVLVVESSVGNGVKISLKFKIP